jgi:hypothetical protein
MRVFTDIDFELGQRVYLKAGGEFRGTVSGLVIRPTCNVYLVTWQDATERSHFSIELTAEKIPEYVEHDD